MFACWHLTACVIVESVQISYHSVAGAVQIKTSTEQVPKAVDPINTSQ